MGFEPSSRTLHRGLRGHSWGGSPHLFILFWLVCLLASPAASGTSQARVQTHAAAATRVFAVTTLGP